LEINQTSINWMKKEAEERGDLAPCLAAAGRPSTGDRRSPDVIGDSRPRRCVTGQRSPQSPRNYSRLACPAMRRFVRDFFRFPFCFDRSSLRMEHTRVRCSLSLCRALDAACLKAEIMTLMHNFRLNLMHGPNLDGNCLKKNS
jgi:hypothetical protein